MNRKQKTTATNNSGRYKNFGIIRKFASVWGVDAESIINVEVEISDDQSEPNTDKCEYWGWYDNSKDKFTLIFDNYLLLVACFPYDINKYSSEGKAYRLNIHEC